MTGRAEEATECFDFDKDTWGQTFLIVRGAIVVTDLWNYTKIMRSASSPYQGTSHGYETGTLSHPCGTCSCYQNREMVQDAHCIFDQLLQPYQEPTSRDDNLGNERLDDIPCLASGGASNSDFDTSHIGQEVDVASYRDYLVEDIVRMDHGFQVPIGGIPSPRQEYGRMSRMSLETSAESSCYESNANPEDIEHLINEIIRSHQEPE
ncbi:hypothetical protein QAD02_005965 [Eretmocerus hayati]|uniref:Uncharacterized protein n=1 Tax=Eretmocerus hayati TaxID=131215 RepID=A0ACC2N041_9HYME|nr:hypothetical protein QAD02_005965 [Eretmocerus hayati]